MEAILILELNCRKDVRCKPIEYYVSSNGCWICINRRLDKDGYPKIKHKQKSYRLSRFIYEILVGEIPENCIIRHKCDNPTCINPDHFDIGTYKQNSEDRDTRGRSGSKLIRGESHGNCKLTLQDVKEIRDSELSSCKLSKVYNVSTSQILRIKSRVRWKHV